MAVYSHTPTSKSLSDASRFKQEDRMKTVLAIFVAFFSSCSAVLANGYYFTINNSIGIVNVGELRGANICFDSGVNSSEFSDFMSESGVTFASSNEYIADVLKNVQFGDRNELSTYRYLKEKMSVDAIELPLSQNNNMRLLFAGWCDAFVFDRNARKNIERILSENNLSKGYDIVFFQAQ